MKTPPVVSASEWNDARQRLLAQEKELTRARDAMAAARRQLVIYRAFFEPGVVGWPEHACHGCSLMADQVAPVVHLNARDVTFACASRAGQADIARLKQRMGWDHPWYTITSDWDTDHGVDQYHGTNAFFRDGDQVYRTYFIDNRGDEALGGTWSYLDMTVLGRQEAWEDSPDGHPQTPPYNWWNWNDSYDHPELAQGPVKGWSGPGEAVLRTGVPL